MGLHQRIALAVRLGGDPLHGGAHHAVQQDVALQRRRARRVRRAQQQMAPQADAGRGHGGGPGVVALLAAAGDDPVAAAVHGLGQQELQLAHLVAGQRGAGEVVLLAQDLHADLA